MRDSIVNRTSKKIKREANFGLLFSHYIKAYPEIETATFELKQTNKDSIAFSAVKDHQIAWLKASVQGTFLYKPPDDSRGIKPCDYILIRKAKDAYIVIKYPAFFAVISVFVFEKESQTSLRRSLTSNRAQEIAHIVVHI